MTRLPTLPFFFDYDLDGDLDCFVLNNSYTDPKRIAANAAGRRPTTTAPPEGIDLYENIGQTSFDVTEKSRLYSGDIDFLNVSVGDLNNDLYPGYLRLQ